MNEQIVKTNNRLIAEFMGVKPVDGWYNGWELHKAGLPFAYGAMGNGTHDLKFHTSWDWLMPVVEKIERDILPDDSVITITYKDCQIPVLVDEFDIIITGASSKHEAVYEAVIEFIKWYNLNN